MGRKVLIIIVNSSVFKVTFVYEEINAFFCYLPLSLLVFTHAVIG